ncbi:response regulator [Desulforhabdus amnigena]|jgi:DNA-binding NtrC family response regulator|uniref:Response regulatory domain-containing protein n=1 Tax=Desulforhabdus amnigena TaxID=40218 RepID=A0A9W6FTG2_9BACT|nr:response regulator [Desulforhabdus amnigena]NLJ27653.1 response regulator [Deltaproteobacteria bacterium]GLI33186.1 hypothetical protein DAMNIGENAA_06190 [Desulforhabdus amnigena]
MKNIQEIFVVDDDQGILDSFDALLGDDYPLAMFNDSSRALRLLYEKNPRLLFLDIKMPGMSGIEVLKWIRDKKLATKVVIVTALPQSHYEESAHQYGIYRYLKKPLDIDEVEEITREALH